MRSQRFFYAIFLALTFAYTAKAQAAQALVCKAYTPVSAPAAGAGPILSIINVADEFELSNVIVRDISIDAPNTAGLKISLSAGVPGAADEPTTVILKDVRTAAGASGLAGVKFDDDSAGPMLSEATGVISGSFIPQQMLLSLSTGGATTAGAGGSKGVWVLRVVDLTPGATAAPKLNAWTLELCPTVPLVTASQGPVEDTEDVIPAEETTIPTTPDMEVMPPVVDPAVPADIAIGLEGVNATAAGNATRPAGLIEDLLDRLNNVAERSPFFNISRATLRESLTGSNDTLLDTLNDRISTLLAPFNDTLVARTLNNVTTGNGPIISTIREWTNSSAAAAAGGVPTFRSTTNVSADAAEQGVVLSFLNSFRDLVNLAADNTTGDNATAMFQSGIGIAGDMMDNIRSTMANIGSGNMFRSMMNGGKIRDMIFNYKPGPVVSAFQSAFNNAGAAVSARTSEVVGDVSKAAQLHKTYRQSQREELTKAMSEGKASATTFITEHINNYRDLVQGGGALVQAVLRRQAERQVRQTEALLAACREALDALNKLRDSNPVRAKISQLLNKQVGLLSQLRDASSGLGSDATKVGGALFQAYQAQVDAVRSAAGEAATGQVEKAKRNADAALSALIVILDKCSDFIDAATAKTGPLGDAALNQYKSGLTWLESQVEGMQSVVRVAPAPKFDGSLLRSLADNRPFAKALAGRWRDSTGATSGVSGMAMSNLMGSIDRFRGSMGKAFGRSA